MSKGEQIRIFVTGATGYIGRVVTELAVGEGYNVHGLSRNEQGDARLRALGATPVRGELTSLDVLRQESAQADAVLHLAFINQLTGGYDYEEILRIDAAAVEALAEPLRGTKKALVITSGTALVESDPAGGETTEESPPSQNPINGRIRSEHHALRLREEGVRVTAIRLSPFVYGRGGSGVVLFMHLAIKAGESVYIGDGSVHTSGVYVDDAATLYLLAAREAKDSEVFNACGSTFVTQREMAEAIGAVLKLPVRSISREEAETRWGKFLTGFVEIDNRPSNLKAIQQLGWQPKGIDLLTEIRSGSYVEVAETLRQG